MVYDEFQQKAIDYIKEGYSVIVSAPTGAGKTAIAEYIITECLEKARRVIYTAPIKALSNQKFRDFQDTYKDKIGILTGDVTINPHAAVLIMTTEIFRNKLLEGSSGLKDYSWIIFDEVHYIDDYERGTVWEESLIFLPEHMNVLALSATIPNVNELADWFHSIHKKPLKIVTEEKRPVPLHFYYQCGGEIVDDIKKIREYKGTIREREGKAGKVRQNRPVTLINHLWSRGRLPCIYFCFGRRRCEYLAEDITGSDFLDNYEKRKVEELYTELCKKFDLLGEKSAESMRHLIERGIAYHHAGMLPTLKEVIERLFTSKLIKIIFTTETFALGINMPARTVAFDELRKFYGKYFSNLRTRDFYQMAGRAGRRGMDDEGYVYSRVNLRYISTEDLRDVIFGQPEMVKSRFNASYATILNLYSKHAEKLYDIYPFSFHYFQQKEKLRQRALGLLRAKVNILKELSHIEQGKITAKGHFASKVYGYELPLAELYATDVLEDLSETELALLCLAMVYEPRKTSARPALSKRARFLNRVTDDTLRSIHHVEKRLGITPQSKNCYYYLSPALEAWMKEEDFNKILRYTDADEGELIRYFRMTIQILREITDTPVSPALKDKARNAIAIINRDVVDAVRQLQG